MRNLVLIVLLVVAWGIFFWNGANSLIAFLALLLVTALFYMRVRRGFRRAAAANNVVAAAATFMTLNDETKNQVALKTTAILGRSGWRQDGGPTFPTDVARWGWYALAMNELDIQPVCLISHWNVVRNPFTALLITDFTLDAAIDLAEKDGYKVNISREPWRI